MIEMIEFDLDADGIATLRINVADRPMNVLNVASIAALDEAIGKAVQDSRVKGVIITSSRPEFLAGGDLDLIRDLRSAQEAMDSCASVSRPLRWLETSGKPFVAAINGTALGGGLELCLACHRRIVADDPSIALGLPEVTLGLLPAGGGTQRLPRMIGIAAAMPYLLEGRKATPQQAFEAGIVDEVVPREKLLERAREWLKSASPEAAVKPWDAKGFRFPGGTPQAAGPMMMYFGASARLLGKTQGLYPAPEAILACVYDGCQVDLDTGLKIEQRQFSRLAVSPATKNMIQLLFYSMGEANRLADRPAGVPRRSYSTIGILGAGMIGAGLALVCANAGLSVVLLDVDAAAAERGKASAQRSWDAAVAKGRLSAAERDGRVNALHATTEFADLADCDLVIEAVFESRPVKAEVIRRAEEHLRSDAVFASNTSTLSISGLAEYASHPRRFVGLHFFSPVDKMPLVEVVRGPRTDPTTIAAAMDFVKRIRKTPIVVNDCPAFYANRAFGTFPYEAMILLKEGVQPALIENASRMAGMPMPALALIDEFSVELLHKALVQRRVDLGTAYVASPQDSVLDDMVERFQRIGRKAGKGFYDYAPDGSRQLWSGLAEHYPIASVQPTLAEVQQRLMFVQSLEAARCVEEKIVGVRDANVGSLLGWGFPATLGGVIGQIDTVGRAFFVEVCDRLAATHGERFKVPESLRVGSRSA